MRKEYGKVFVFIDGNNFYLGAKKSGWKVDPVRFKKWLDNKFSVTTAYYFIGRVKGKEWLYEILESAGYKIVYKPTIRTKDGVKGNIDADLVLQVMIDYPNYDKAIIVTSDGDFYSTVRYLRENNKLLYVISPYSKKLLSKLLCKEAGSRILFLEQIKNLVQYKKREGNT